LAGHREAVEGLDYDVTALPAVENHSAEDKTIVEMNQAG